MTRQAARSRIAAVAEELFADKGFDATTVEEIVTAVGISQRSFFRYFTSKEDLLLGDYDQLEAEFVRRLDSRPVGESDWDALRRMFDVISDEYADIERRSRRARTLQMIERSPVLLAAYLARFERIQNLLCVSLEKRSLTSYSGSTDLLRRATVGSAFACLHAALSRSAASPSDDFVTQLDTVMEQVRPAYCTLGTPT